MTLLKTDGECYVVELKFYNFISKTIENVIEIEKTYNQYKVSTFREKYLIKTKESLYEVFADTIEDISWRVQ